MGRRFVIVLAPLLAVSLASAETPLGSAFTYQGELTYNGDVVNDQCDFSFALWDDVIGGVEVVAPVDLSAVAVVDGRFAVELDFGAGPFIENARWIEVSVGCPAGGGATTTLGPRQQLTPTPQALYSLTTSAMDWAGLGSVPPGLDDGDDVLSQGQVESYAEGVAYDTPAELTAALEGATLAVDLACPVDWVSVAGGRLCLDPAVRGPDDMHGAITDCSTVQARVCTHNDFQQACGAVMYPYVGMTAPGWYGDHGVAVDGNGDDEFLTFNLAYCNANNDSPARHSNGSPTVGGVAADLEYKCCW